jgi:hypothetical protein
MEAHYGSRELRHNSMHVGEAITVRGLAGEDYLYPADYFVFVELPQKAKRAWTVTRRPAKRRSSSNITVQRTGARAARSGR